MTLQQTIDIWKDDQETHRLINETYTKCVNANPELKAYRDWIESNIFGFGERSFIYLWKLLVQEMPEDLRFLEIGVFRGQVLGIIRKLAPKAFICGITPLSSEGGFWESEYKADIKYLHDTFDLPLPNIIEGLSTEEVNVDIAKTYGPYDIVYIDGGHDYKTVVEDLSNYPPMVSLGGYLVIDDCCDKYNLPNGYFRGIATVSKAVDDWCKHTNKSFKEEFSIVHIRVFKRVS